MEIQMTSYRHQQQWVTLNKLRKQGKFCDVMFLMNENDEYDRLNDSIITAHSCVLSASSPILYGKLAACYSTCHNVTNKMLVSLEDVSTAVWELVLDYIYCRKASISKTMPKSTVKSFVNVLAKLKLVSAIDFKSICEYCRFELDIDDIEEVDKKLNLIIKKYPPDDEEVDMSETPEESDNDCIEVTDQQSENEISLLEGDDNSGTDEQSEKETSLVDDQDEDVNDRDQKNEKKISLPEDEDDNVTDLQNESETCYVEDQDKDDIVTDKQNEKKISSAEEQNSSILGDNKKDDSDTLDNSEARQEYEIIINSDNNTSFENDGSLANKSFESCSIPNSSLLNDSNVECEDLNVSSSFIEKILPGNTELNTSTLSDLNEVVNETNSSNGEDMSKSQSDNTLSNCDLSFEPLPEVKVFNGSMLQENMERENEESLNLDSETAQLGDSVPEKEGTVSLDLTKATYKQVVFCPLDIRHTAVIKGVVEKQKLSDPFIPAVVKPAGVYSNAMTVKNFLDNSRKQMKKQHQYSCETCGMKFLVGGNLSKHIRDGCNPYKYKYLEGERRGYKAIQGIGCVDQNISWKPNFSTSNELPAKPILNVVTHVKQEPLSDSEEQSNLPSDNVTSASILKQGNNTVSVDSDLQDVIDEVKKRKGRPLKSSLMLPHADDSQLVKEYVGLNYSKPRGKKSKKLSMDYSSVKVKKEPQDKPAEKKMKVEYISEDEEEFDKYISELLSGEDDSRDSDYMPFFKAKESDNSDNDDDIDSLTADKEDLDDKEENVTPRKRGRPKGSKSPSKVKREKPNKDGDVSKDSIVKRNRVQRPVYKTLKNDNVCNLCGKTFPDGSRLAIQAHQKEECNVALSPNFKDRPKYLCPFCEKQLSCNYKLTFHIKICHLGERPYMCKICDASFKDRNTHRDHMMEVHDEGCIICKYCGIKFLNLEKYKKHRALEHAEEINKKIREDGGTPRSPKAYICDVCSYISLNESKLKRHMQFHTNINEWEFSCEVCHKRFVQKSDLKKHMMIHTGEKPFLCEHCSYATNRGSNLKLHMRKHIADRAEVTAGDVTEYKCTECDEVFRLKTELKDHFRIHDTRRQKQNRNTQRRSTRQKARPNYDESKDEIMDESKDEILDESKEETLDDIKFNINKLGAECMSDVFNIPKEEESLT